MKRLIKKISEDQNNQLNKEQNDNLKNENPNKEDINNKNINDDNTIQRLRDEIQNDKNNLISSNMIPLDELDEADIRHDKCPNCKCKPIERKEGFKICPSCNMVYKIYDGKAYIIME